MWQPILNFRGVALLAEYQIEREVTLEPWGKEIDCLY